MCRAGDYMFKASNALRTINRQMQRDCVQQSYQNQLADLSNSFKYSDHGNWLKVGFQRVKHLKLSCCEELIYMWQMEICIEKPPQGPHSFNSLRKLRVTDLPSPISFPETGFLSVLSELEIGNCSSLASLLQVIMKHDDAHLEHLKIECCHSLTFIARGQLPSSLKRLEVKDCEKLQCLLDDKDHTLADAAAASSSAEIHKENIKNTSISLLQYLFVSQCPSLACFSSNGPLPRKLQELRIECCSKLESITERFYSNWPLRYIFIRTCENIRSISEGLQNLSQLGVIFISNCPSLVSFPKEGLPSTNLGIQVRNCEKLEALPNYLHILNSLRHLEFWRCPRIISFPKEGLPTNLTSLSLVLICIKKPLLERGLHKLTSLYKLRIDACSESESFPPEEMGMVLPTSLTALTIDLHLNLKYLSSKGFQNLTSLEYLYIFDCPKFISFPEAGLPSSLLKLYIRDCPLLKKQCRRNQGKEWSKIAYLPCIDIDGKIICYLEDEE